MNIQTCFLFFMLAAATAQAQPDTVVIGTQTWMAKNLDTDKFSNGDPIPQAKTPAEWAAAYKNKTPAWCYYNNDPKMGAAHGKLYNAYALKDKRGIAPKGWHLPTRNDFAEIEVFLAPMETVGTKMKSTTGWFENGNGTNESGFNATPAGSRTVKGEFTGSEKYTYWWTSTDDITDVMLAFFVNHSNGYTKFVRDYMGDGLSVRLVSDHRNYAKLPSVKISQQTWMNKNLDVSTFNNGDAILHCKTRDEWKKAAEEKTPAWCYHKFDETYAETHGKIYNWYAMADSRGIAPIGWHIPKKAEWEILLATAGDSSSIRLSAAGQEKFRGTNNFGFSALRSGLCFDNGGFSDISSSYWAQGDLGGGGQYCDVSGYQGNARMLYSTKGYGMAVRLVMDGGPQLSPVKITYPQPLPCTGKETVKDIDGNIYNTVQYGNQCWLKENLAVTRYADGKPLLNGIGKGDITGQDDKKYWFAYKDSLKYKPTFGLLYTWAAVVNGKGGTKTGNEKIQGICPKGWHVPSDAEWEILLEFRTKNNIDFPYVMAGGKFYGGQFFERGRRGYWWTSTQGEYDFAYFRQRERVEYHFSYGSYTNVRSAYSVRCVCDE